MEFYVKNESGLNKSDLQKKLRETLNKTDTFNL